MNEQKEKLGAFPFVIGGLSFIPLVGVMFGIIAIIWGLVTTKRGGKKLAIVGALGIAFTIIIYSCLFYFGFVKRGGIYDELRAKLAKSTITSLVQTIEFYKIQNGKYPESLKVLADSLPKDSLTFIYDPAFVGLAKMPRYFYYELVGTENYYLLGVGPDGEPFTADDILPDIQVKPGSKIGLLIKEESKSSL